MGFPEFASRIVDVLNLDTPPIALSFVDHAPAGVPDAGDAAPSACSFWRRAETGVFYASAAAHFNCPVGAMVMGFALPGEIKEQLGKLVGDMSDCNYVSHDEPGQIPGVAAPHAGIVYGPLAESRSTPDVVLLWVSPRQAMLCNEAMGTASWTAGGPAVTGRPGCAALPLAMNRNNPVISLGCAGMRTFTEIADDRLLVAIPGGQLEKFTHAVEGTGQANKHMLGFYQAQRARLLDGTAHVTG